MTEDFQWCGHLALPRFRRQAEGGLTGCCQAPHHTGNHVYALKVGEPLSAIHYYEEIERGVLKPVTLVDLEPGELTDEEIAAMWQYLNMVRAARQN